MEENQKQAPYPLDQPPNLSAPPDTPEQATEEPPAEKHQIRAVISTLALFLIAPLIALLLTMFVIRSYEVDGPSMEKTLQNADLLIVNKLPKTIAKVTGKAHIPSRYEVIIFTRNSGEEGLGEQKQLVKRVIGLPGERVVVEGGKITVYNQQNPDGFNPDQGQAYAKDHKGTPGNADITLEENEIFVVGDNRHNSLDSRYFGPIHTDDVVGDLAIRIFPLNKIRSF